MQKLTRKGFVKGGADVGASSDMSLSIRVFVVSSKASNDGFRLLYIDREFYLGTVHRRLTEAAAYD